MESQIWTPLLGYLSSRNFAAGEAIFGRHAEAVRSAVQEKVADTVGAVIGALIAVGSGRFEHFAIEEQWLSNLANWFQGIPDGPVILARRLSDRARSKNERQAVRDQLLEAYRRGIPICSLSLEWLDQGLAEYGLSEDKEAMAVVRRVATRVNPAKPFTTISLGPGGRIQP
ncbi:hypothetical protein AJ88_23705 [Mesorhizobium amorphae CCBAU 01583]|nr:hypothetical protein AJ88_23705 [Mesorhizobium amorphae CCBAU 01583]